MYKITQDQLKQFAGKTYSPEMVDAFNEAFTTYGLLTRTQVIYFLAETFVESMAWTRLRENLNYSVKGLRTTFKKYFINDVIATEFARQPERIANRVYANRIGNGNYASGDGWKYRGGGVIQLTGKDNFAAFQKSIAKIHPSVDLVKNPELITTMPFAILSAGFFWQSNKLNAYCDKGDFLGLSQRINGSGNAEPNGWTERQAALKKALKIFK